MGVSPRADLTMRAVAILTTGIVAASSGLLSFNALAALARGSGIAPALSFVYPLMVDGAVIAGSVLAVSASLKGQRSFYGFFVIAVGSALSIYGNLHGAGALPSVADTVVHVSPSLVMILAIEVLASLLRSRLALVAAQAAAEAEEARKAEAKAERERQAQETARAKAEAAAAAAQAAKEKADARAAATAQVDRALGRKAPVEGAVVRRIREYAASIEGWSQLSLAKRTAALVVAFNASSGDIVASGVCSEEGETRDETMRRVSKTRTKVVARMRDEGAGNSATRALHAVGA